MKLLYILSLSLVAVSCSKNPFGNSNISSCLHGHTSSTGLPVNCSITPPTSTNLAAWLDANDPGTLITQNQTEVNSWLDKSGNGRNLDFLSGSPAESNKKSINDRNSLLFDSAQGSYNLGGITGFPSGQDFTLALIFKINSPGSSPLRLSNGSGFSFNIESTGALTYSIGLATDISTGVTLNTGSSIKIIVFYRSSDQTLGFLNATDLVFSASHSSLPLWTDLQIDASSGLEIGEILLYDDSANTSSIQTYLNSKWGS